MKNILSIIICGFCLFFNACTKEYLNPSSASETQIINDVNGLISLCNGLQQKYTIGRASPMYTIPTTSGLLTGELVNLNAGNTDEANLQAGDQSVGSSNNVLKNLWEQLNLIKSNANIILKNADIAKIDGVKVGIIAHASLFKALSLGGVALFWEKAPLVVQTNAPFVTRTDLINEAINILLNVETILNTTAISTDFSSKVQGANIDYKNTILALIARYYNLLGNNDKAIEYANKVDLTMVSNFIHDVGAAKNAIFESSFSNRNVGEPKDTFFNLPVGLRTTPGDNRTTKFFRSPAVSTSINLGLSTTGFFATASTSVPIYRPSEMILILAEAYTRKNDLPNALIQINKILTKTSDPVGITAKLTPFAGTNDVNAYLTEIYKQRCIELYLTGLRFEDSKRFLRPISERNNRDFMPYPNSERDNNINTPINPDK
ncbi:MAG: RagB/SusD family nutrient uptake outer membrane protein [Sediminibacterium sp.]|nr:RagB/SusD family nutrient uptake outer membrane protein [Sediminibacterium sp.]